MRTLELSRGQQLGRRELRRGFVDWRRPSEWAGAAAAATPTRTRRNGLTVRISAIMRQVILRRPSAGSPAPSYTRAACWRPRDHEPEPTSPGALTSLWRAMRSVAHRVGRAAVVLVRAAARPRLVLHPRLDAQHRRRHPRRRPVHAGAGAVGVQGHLVAAHGSVRPAVLGTTARMDGGHAARAGRHRAAASPASAAPGRDLGGRCARASAVAIASASQDIAIDAYAVEVLRDGGTGRGRRGAHRPLPRRAGRVGRRRDHHGQPPRLADGERASSR